VGLESKNTDTIPFIHNINLEGPKGEIVRVRGLFDDGALVNAMCLTVFDKVKERLGLGIPSTRRLRMANGLVITSNAYWKGYVGIGNIRVEIAFEVFDSRGN